MILESLGYPQELPTIIDCDNHSAISWSDGKDKHSASRHVDVRYEYVKDQVRNKELVVQYLPTDVMPADMLTKVLQAPKLQPCRDLVMNVAMA